MSSSPLAFSAIVLIFLLGVAAGLWIGLGGLWRSRRGPAWWLMATGVTLNTLGPIAMVAGSMMQMAAFQRAAAAGSFTGSQSNGAEVLMVGGGFMIPIGLMLFAIGFALHGMRTARAQQRIGELEQLTQAMDEEISRLKKEPSRP